MAGGIRLYGGAKSAMPELPERTPGYCTDSGELYIGTEGGNALLASRRSAGGSFDRLTLPGGSIFTDAQGRLAYNRGGEAKPVALRAKRVEALGTGASLELAAAKVNELIAALKEAGAMEE